jgi:hypothetical protein
MNGSVAKQLPETAASYNQDGYGSLVISLLSEGEPVVDANTEPDIEAMVQIVSTPLGQRFQAKCKSNPGILPEIACDVEWSDRFYEKRKKVLLAFDIDYEKLERELVTEWRAKCTRLFYSIGTVGLCCVPGLLIFDFALFFVAFAVMPFLFILVAPTSESALQYVSSIKTKEMILLMRRHIAITKDGVCLDDSDEPGSLNLVRRQVIKLDSIAKCCVKDVGWFRPSYRVWIYPEGTEDGNAACRAFSIRGLVNGQEFADIVQAMADLKRQTSVEC